VAYQNLLLAFEGRVAVLTVNRPEKRNALDGATVAEFHAALDAVRAARASVMIVTGAGDRAFVSGADIAAIRSRRRDDALRSVNSRLMAAVEAHEARAGGLGECSVRPSCAEHAVRLPERRWHSAPGHQRPRGGSSREGDGAGRAGRGARTAW
jgi:hypothetical protein